MKRIILWTIMLLVTALPEVYASDSLLTEKEVPLLTEKTFTDVIKKGNCIVMYYEPNGNVPVIMGMNALQLGDFWMRSMIKFRDSMGSLVKFYRVNWKGFSPDAMKRIRTDIGSGDKLPGNPTFVVYPFNAKPSRVRGPVRPDLYTWFLHDIMDDYMPVSKKPMGDYLYAGWMITDTSAQFINVANERREEISFAGRTETVQVIKYVSQYYDGFSCEFERLYARNSKLLGSIESCGKYGKYGYFDYDNTGKYQYRVKYDGQAEKEKKQQ